jgi:elongation of very long chain fatty acids protein 7
MCVKKCFNILNWFSDPRIADQPIVASFYQIPLIIFAYLYFVLGYGPKFMKNRSPYKLKTFMQLYNIIQIFINTFLIYEAFDGGLFLEKIICPVLNYSYDDNFMRVIIYKSFFEKIYVISRYL